MTPTLTNQATASSLARSGRMRLSWCWPHPFRPGNRTGWKGRSGRWVFVPNLDLARSASYTRPSFMKRSLLPGLSAWLIFLGVFVPAETRSEPVMVNGIAARVNDAIITFQQIEGEMDEPERLLRSQLRNQPDVLKQRITQLRNDTVELLIERLLILDDFNTNPNYKLPESVVEDVIRRRIRDKFGDRTRMIKTLEQQGIKQETFR